MRRTLNLFTAAAILTAAVLFAAPAQANHITTWDCAVWDQHRGPSANVSVGVRWSFSDVYQKYIQIAVHNWDVYPHAIKLNYQATDHSTQVWKSTTLNVGSQSIYTLVETSVAHSQYYHPSINVYKDGTYVFRMGPWSTNTQGDMTKVANLTNCP